VKKRVTVEAASTFGWDRYAGDEGVKIGIDHYGASAPGDEVMKKFGFTVGNVRQPRCSLLGRDEEAKKESASEETAFTGPTVGHGGH
jgi:transketolase